MSNINREALEQLLKLLKGRSSIYHTTLRTLHHGNNISYWRGKIEGVETAIADLQEVMERETQHD